MGHLFKRNGVYYMGLKDRRGRWRQRSCGTKDKRAAQHKLDEAERLMAFGEPKLLKEFLDEYVKRQASSLESPRYQFCRDILTDDHSPLAGLTLQEVDVAACTRYITWRFGHKRSKATVLKEVRWLKAAMDAAAEEGYVSWDRAYQLRRKKWAELKGANRSRERVLLPHEREILFDAARGNENLHASMTLAFWTGLRRENILQLTEAQVDFTCEPPVIRFSPAQMKNRTGHIVLLAPEAREVLWQRWQGSPSRRFFADFRPAWKRLQRRLETDGKLVDFNFHDFRRTYTTYRLAAGIDIKAVQDEVGHRTSRMTLDVYGRAVRDPAVRAYAARHFRFPWDSPTPAATVDIPRG